MTNYVRNTTETVVADGMVALATGRFAIEAQEADGQRQLAASTVLPAEMRDPREVYEALGFAFGHRVEGDPLFVHGKLPSGWSKRPTDHPLWTDIVDERGRKRALVCYKAAFYDRYASMSLCCRYVVECIWDQRTWKRTDTMVVDRATGETLQRWSPGSDEEACAWLDENVPNHRDIVASWAGA